MKQQWTPAEIRAYYQARAPKLKLTGGASAKEWRGPCPVHNGKRDSFAVSPSTGQAYCHSGCGRGWSMVELERELGHASSLQEAAKSIRAMVGGDAPKNGTKKLLATHPYTDEDGKLLYEVLRFAPKSFSQRRPMPSGKWEYKLGDVRRVLFRLPKILQAEEVFVVEGEKDVITLERLGFIATTCAMGAGKWRAEYAQPLTGKLVRIIPDSDAPGIRHAADVARSVIGKARDVRIIKLPNGKDVTDWVEAGGDEWQMQELVENARVETVESVKAMSESLSPPPAAEQARRQYRITGEGVMYQDPNPDMRPFKICGPLEIVAITRNAAGEEWGRWLRWKDPDGRQHQWAMPVSVLAGDGREVAERLLSGGLFLEPGPRARMQLNYYLRDDSVEKRARCVARVGWHSQSFVLPDATIGSESEHILYQTTVDMDHHLVTAGTLDQWREKVAKLASKNSRLILSIGTAFAGPCLSLLGVESGGIHFCGSTSSGKSTALVVGASVLGGGGPNGFVQSWRATANGLEAVAELHNDLTLFLDELAQLDPKEAAETAYLLANGAGKARMTKSVTQRRKLSWRLLFVSAGEVTLADHANKGARLKGGAEIRLLTVEADAGAGSGLFETTHGMPPDEFARTLKAAAIKYYGTPLREMLAQLTGERRGHWIQRLKAVQLEFMRKHYAGRGAGANEISRAVTRFAAIAAAGEVATEMGITGWKAGEASVAASVCFESWLGMRGSVASSDLDAAVRQVRHFLEISGASRFQVIRGGNNDTDQVVPNRAGFRAISEGETEYIILTEVWRREVCAGFDAKAVAAELLRRGHLEEGTDEAHPHTPLRRLPEMGQRRVYVVKASLLGEEV